MASLSSERSLRASGLKSTRGLSKLDKSRDMVLRHLNSDGSSLFFPLLKLLSLSNDLIHSAPRRGDNQLPVGHWRVFLHLCLVVQSLHKSQGTSLEVAAMTPIRTSRAEISAACQRNYTWDEAESVMHTLQGHQLRVDYKHDVDGAKREGSVSFGLLSFADVRKDQDEITFLLSPVLTALVVSTEANFTRLDLALLRLTPTTTALRLALLGSSINNPLCRQTAVEPLAHWREMLADDSTDSRTFLQRVRRGIEQVNAVSRDFDLLMEESRERASNARGKATVTGFRFLTRPKAQASLMLEGGEGDTELMQRLAGLDGPLASQRPGNVTWALNVIEDLGLGKYDREWFVSKLSSVERSEKARSKISVFKKVLSDGEKVNFGAQGTKKTVNALRLVNTLGQAEMWFAELPKARQIGIQEEFRQHLLKEHTDAIKSVGLQRGRELEAALWVPFLSRHYRAAM